MDDTIAKCDAVCEQNILLFLLIYSFLHKFYIVLRTFSENVTNFYICVCKIIKLGDNKITDFCIYYVKEFSTCLL